MKCPYCQSEHNAYNCPNCGAPAPEMPKGVEPPGAQQPREGKKQSQQPKKVAWWSCCLSGSMISFVIIIFIIVFAGIFFNEFGASNRRSTARPASAPPSEEPPTPSPTEIPKPTPYPGTKNYLELTEDGYRASSQEMPEHDALMRYPEDYLHNDYRWDLRVVQVLEDSEGAPYYRCYLILADIDSYSYLENPEYVVYDRRMVDNALIFEGDDITVYGDYAGLGELKRALMGNVDRVPAVNARYIDIEPEY